MGARRCKETAGIWILPPGGCEHGAREGTAVGPLAEGFKVGVEALAVAGTRPRPSAAVAAGRAAGTDACKATGGAMHEGGLDGRVAAALEAASVANGAASVEHPRLGGALQR